VVYYKWYILAKRKMLSLQSSKKEDVIIIKIDFIFLFFDAYFLCNCVDICDINQLIKMFDH